MYVDVWAVGIRVCSDTFDKTWLSGVGGRYIPPLHNPPTILIIRVWLHQIG